MGETINIMENFKVKNIIHKNINNIKYKNININYEYNINRLNKKSYTTNTSIKYTCKWRR